jgi:TetR/AcrR family transcriptional repressor of lmrAB and yxaGH operons
MVAVIVKSDSREQMIRSAIELLRERGYTRTSFGDVIAHSGAPRGSIYHHFPGGKEQLVTEAVRRYATMTLAAITHAAESGSSVDTVRVFVETVRSGLRASDFRFGCAIAGVVLDLTSEEAALLQLTAESFRAWRTRLAAAFRKDGATEAQARRLATLVVASVEGALILARAERDLTPVTDIAHELEAHIRHQLPGGE